MGCTRMAGSDYPMDTKFMTVSKLEAHKGPPLKGEMFDLQLPSETRYTGRAGGVAAARNRPFVELWPKIFITLYTENPEDYRVILQRDQIQ